MSLVNLVNVLRFVSFVYHLSLRSFLYFIFFTVGLVLHLSSVWVLFVLPILGGFPHWSIISSRSGVPKSYINYSIPFNKALYYNKWSAFTLYCLQLRTLMLTKDTPKKKTIRRDRVISTEIVYSLKASLPYPRMIFTMSFLHRTENPAAVPAGSSLTFTEPIHTHHVTV